jgi:pyroglutamyl-peptidase
MTEKPTILVTGFGAWAIAENNPAAQVAARLAREAFDFCNLVTAELDVDTNALQDKVNYLLDEHQPDGWIGLGVSRSAVIKPEMVGINWRHFGVPDATGARLQATPIVENGPAAYNATLPCAEMVEKLRANHIPAMLSFSAGTHLCNQLIYVLGHTAKTRGMSLRNGFVHIPQSPENIAEKCGADDDGASMDLATSTRAIRICVQVLAAELAAF